MTELNTGWSVWIRAKSEKSWKIDGYNNAYNFKTIEDFWGLMKCIKEFNPYDEMYFMRENIQPIYEDKENINGGQISIMLPRKNIMDNFYEIISTILCETSCNHPMQINGIVAILRSKNIIFKIWIKDYDFFFNKFKNKSLKFNLKNEYINSMRFKKHT